MEDHDTALSVEKAQESLISDSAVLEVYSTRVLVVGGVFGLDIIVSHDFQDTSTIVKACSPGGNLIEEE